MNMRFFAAALLLLAAASFSPIAEAQVPSTFRVFGQVAKPTTFDLTALKKLPATSENVMRFPVD
jgi:DMSO/TMAO reductase YedYZ molybdopterin-dependent catalytic subunit